MKLIDVINTMPGITGSTSDQDVWIWGTAKTMQGPIQYKDVRSYLHVTMELPAILASANPAALAMIDVLDHFENVDLNNAIILTAITTQLSALITANLLQESSRDYILAMNIKQWSPFESKGFVSVTLGQVTVVRGNV